MADHEGELFRHIDGEKSLNDFFSSLLARSNTSRVLNAVHRDIRFRNDAEVVATQRDGLDEHPDENSKLRTLDWVVKDGGKMVGYESKTGNPLDATQLQEERRKLNENADGREVHLYAITEDIRRPELPTEFDWMSWRDVGKAVNDLAEGSDKESPIIQLMADMFTSEGYDGFRGFTDYSRDEEWLRREYVKEERSLRDIADGVGSSDFWVRHWLMEHGIPTRTPWRSDLDERLDDPEWLREKYHDEGMTLAEIAEEAGCSWMTVSNRLREHDIETRGRSRR